MSSRTMGQKMSKGISSEATKDTMCTRICGCTVLSLGVVPCGFSSVSATIRAGSTSRTSQAPLPSHWVIAWSAAWCNSSASLDMLGVSSMGSLSGAWRARIIFSKVGYAEQPAATSSLPKATWKSCSRGFSRGAKPKARCSCMANKTRWWFPARWMVWIGNGSSPTKTSNPVTTATSGSSEDRRIVAPTMP